MRHELRRRLARLQTRAGINSEPQKVMVVQFVEPCDQFGGRPCRSDRAEANGHVWLPQPGETEAEFEKRVLAEVTTLRERPTLVIMWPGPKVDEPAEFTAGLTPIIHDSVER